MHTILRRIAILAAALAACVAMPAAADQKPPEAAAPAASAPAAPATAAPAPAASATPAPATPAAQPVHPALWKVSDGDTTIYLFGTIHALPPGIDWFNGKVAAAFDDSQELVTEIVVGNADEMQAVVRRRALLAEGQSLRGLLSPAQKTEYEKALTGLGLPAQTFDRFEPWYAAIGLSALPMLRDGFAQQNGVEEELQTRAKALGISQDALETADYQLGLFDKLPLDVQKHYLIEVVEDLPKMKAELMKMVDAWEQGNAAELAQLMNSQEDDPQMIKTLLTDRNHAWAQWIRQRLEKPGTVFLAVGAGHLAGPNGVQAQLKAVGIDAERVQ